MVPVVETRGDEQRLQEPAEAEADVGVDEDGVEGHEEEVGLERAFGEAEEEERHQHEAAGGKDVHPGTRSPSR